MYRYECDLHVRISFTVKELREIKDELLRLATENAKHQAEILTQALNIDLGTIQSISYNRTKTKNDFVTASIFDGSAHEMMMESSSFVVDLSPHDIQVTDSVTCIWEII